MANSTPQGRLCLQEGVWAGFERASDGDPRWEFIDTHHAPDDPSGAARMLCAQAWAGGTHRILVVSTSEAREYEVTLETTEVTDA